jgi:predicted transcriptional regulator
MAFTPEEKRIINVLYAAHKPLTTKRVSEMSELSWQTAKKYLQELYKKGTVVNGRYGKSVYWWLRT